MRFLTRWDDTLGAIHLAAELLFARSHERLGVLSFDERVVRNADALGLAPIV